jgi:hypothetical protein
LRAWSDRPKHRKPSQTIAVVFDDAAEPSLQALQTEHFQNDVLGAYPRRQLTDESNAEHSRHSEMERFSQQGKRHTHPASAKSKHAK